MRRYALSGIALSFAAALSVSTASADIRVATAGPITGGYAAFGSQMKKGAEMAVKDINAAGGVLGQKLVLSIFDDACDPAQAVSVAHQMAAMGIVFVDGHFCSSTSIFASKVYLVEGILEITPASTDPALTDDGGWNVARVCGRDDAQGKVAGEFLAKKYAGKRVAIIHDRTAYGARLAAYTKSTMNANGLTEVMSGAYTQGERDYSYLVSKMMEANIDAVYVGGYHTDAGLILRQMRELGMTAQMISSSDALATDEFWSITGPAGEGTIITSAPDPRSLPSAKKVVDEFRAEGYNPEAYTLYTYAAMQVFAQAATAAGTTDPMKVAEVVRSGMEFDTVLGKLPMDAKGDIKSTTNRLYHVYQWSNGRIETIAPGTCTSNACPMGQECCSDDKCSKNCD